MMAVFANLEDTPMFRKHLYTLEHTSDDLKDRCQKFHKGCKRFMTSLLGACDGDLAFAECMEAFGAGCDDPISVAIGGPVMSKFTTTFRELGTYKELLRSQVEHMLSNRLLEFVNTDIRDAKDSRRRFDKAQLAYDQAREKVMSLKKGTRPEVVAALEEDLHNSKSSYERCRFNLVNALANIEAKKKYEFLESISAVMDAHLRYFKQGYELLSQMEQFIHQVLTYTQQSKEMTRTEHDKLARRIQEYRTHEELDSSRSPRNTEAPTNGDGIHIVGINSYKNIEALMHSSANGEVQTIKQGYLLKQSSSVRGDWKRRFFVLDSHGTLYYYRNKQNKHSGTQQQHSTGLLEHGAGVFGRFRFSHSRSSSHGDENLSCHTVNLQTSTVKIDAEQTDLRFCFRIISPHKSLTLQAENEAERTEWVDKVTAVIASLLNSSFLNQPGSHIVDVDGHCSVGIDGSNFLSRKVQKYPNVKNAIDFVENDVSNVLKNVLGNDVCAECSYPEPGWASLNLGVLICIECSGVHRNLGVHISKVRSLTLDVKVWEPTVLDLFCALGNSYCNSVWEELLTLNDKRTDTDVSNKILASITKPGPRDAISIKEKYIQQKYVEKSLVVKETSDSNAIQFREAVKCSKIKEAYRLLVISDVNPNMTFDMVNANDICDISGTQDENRISKSEIKQYDPANCPKIKATGEPATCFRGCSLLHLACHVGNLVMVELLLQFGADINMQDFHGRTPLHHCVFARNSSLSKYLIRRGASPSIKDGGGETPLERAMKYGPVTDEELFLLLVESD